MICGGFGEDKVISDEELQILNELKSQIEEKLGETFSTFKALSFQTQVVAGTNYLFKVEVDNGRVLNVKIHKPLPYKNQNPHLMTVE